MVAYVWLDLNQLFLDEQAKPGATFSTIARRFEDEARNRVTHDQEGVMPPWQTLRTWARDAIKASQNQTGCDLEDRWHNWQRKRARYCPEGHPLTGTNIYRRTRTNYRTGGTSTVRECRTCRLRQAAKRRDTARRQGKARPPLTFTQDEARALGELLFYRHNRTWLGHRLWMLFLRLAKKEGDDQR